jgi:type I restriction enzyme M protein
MSRPSKSKSSGAAPTTAQQLGSIIKSCRDIMRKDKGLSGDLDRLPMLVWVMFLKFIDDMEMMREEEAILKGENFRPAIAQPYRWRDWAAPEDGITGEALIAFINQDRATLPGGGEGPGLFAYLRSLSGSNGGDRRDVIATVFRGTVNRMISGYLLRDLINKINSIHFSSSEEIHTLSHLYESMLKEMRDAAGDSGEFYTPRPVIRFMVAVTDPRLGEKFLDPACGTGGFLVEIFKHLFKQCNTVEDGEVLQKHSIFGGEAKPLPYMLCQMNLLLHCLEFPQIDSENSLRYPLREIGDKDRVDVILTNPPFGGEEERGILSNFPEDKQTSETALLFLQLIMRKLRRLPRPGALGWSCPTAPSLATAWRHESRRSCCGSSTCILLSDCPTASLHHTPAFPPTCSFSTAQGRRKRSGTTRWPPPEGRKNYTKTKPMQFEEFADCLAWWKDRQEGERAWRVPAEQIAGNGYNLDIKNPKGKKDLEQLPPEELIESILKTEQRILEIISEIKQNLQDGK